MLMLQIFWGGSTRFDQFAPRFASDRFCNWFVLLEVVAFGRTERRGKAGGDLAPSCLRDAANVFLVDAANTKPASLHNVPLRDFLFFCGERISLSSTKTKRKGIPTCWKEKIQLFVDS